MSPVLPGLIAAALGVGAGLVRWPVRPRILMIVLTIVAGASASAAAVAVTALGAGFLARNGAAGLVLEQCFFIPVHHAVPGYVGVIALGALIFGGVRVRRVVASQRRARSGVGDRRMLYLDTDQPIAYAVPGRPGCVVVSSGLMNALTAAQRQVVLAHERAHLHQRHHRYLMIGAISQAILPPLAPLVGQLRLATERCADEAAVSAVGGDRNLVASAIARAALRCAALPAGIAGFGGGSVLRRIVALTSPPATRGTITIGLSGILTACVIALGALTVQLHHITELVLHLCG